jgi:hypothetical protein
MHSATRPRSPATVPSTDPASDLLDDLKPKSGSRRYRESSAHATLALLVALNELGGIGTSEDVRAQAQPNSRERFILGIAQRLKHAERRGYVRQDGIMRSKYYVLVRWALTPAGRHSLASANEKVSATAQRSEAVRTSVGPDRLDLRPD